MKAGTVKKKELTATQAAEQWKAAKREIDRQKPLLEEAKAVLFTHFDRTGRSSYKGIGLVTTPAKLILDQPKVREFLGKRLAEFQTRTSPSKSLTLLGED